MSNKSFGWLIALAICGVVGIWGFCKMLHCNDVQNIQIVQNIDGTIEVRRDGGWYARMFPRIWEYPKASVEICNEGERDAIEMQFSNKTKAKLNCQIGYRIDSTNDELVVKLHQQVEGSDDKIWKKVRTSLQTVAQCVASQYTPSESVEKFPEFAKQIHDSIVHEPNLLAEGIDVVSFTCAGLPNYDTETQAQFAKQKEADLSKRLAEAEKLKLESEKIKVEANYQKEIAEFKGKAEAETAKLVTEAERQKKLAEIEASKKVEVEKLMKEQLMVQMNKEKEAAEIEAQKKLSIAEIQKKTEAEQLQIIEIQAKQKVASAQAKKQEIELSGAITELQKMQLEVDMKTKIGVAEQMAKTYAHWNPQVIQVSGGNGTVGSTTSSLDGFLNMKAAEAALNMTRPDVENGKK